jgi:hypothetical protein
MRAACPWCNTAPTPSDGDPCPGVVVVPVVRSVPVELRACAAPRVRCGPPRRTLQGLYALRETSATERDRQRADVCAQAGSSNASGGGQAQTRLRSPCALSMRLTGGQYLSVRVPAEG